jgi:MFS family permease
MFKKNSEKTTLSQKDAVVTIILIANAFIWYFYAFNYLSDVVHGSGLADFAILIYGINFLGIAFSAVLGASLVNRFQRRMPFLLYWMLAGVIISLMVAISNFADFTGLALLSAVLGVYFGLGMPSCMGYFAASTKTEKRARLGGTTFLLIGLGSVLIGNMGSNNAILTSLILAAWRAVGLVLLIFLKPSKSQIGKNDKISYGSVFSNKAFILYLIPWLMFSIVNDFTFSVTTGFPEDLVFFSGLVEMVIAGGFAVVCGFLADFLGRKRLAIGGFILLGLGYAVLGFFSTNEIGWWFYTSVDGIAWGIFTTIFIMTLWGDLAEGKGSEKYYAIGGLPYLFSNFARLSIAPLVVEQPAYTIFSFASFFLFLAVLPLIYAPETLPEKTIKERELKSYVEKAKKEAKKAQKKEIKSATIEDEDYGIEFEEKIKEAEKYY